MHKAIILAETLTTDSKLQPVAAPHPEVFDPTTTLPALRSGGFSLYADVRAAKLLERLQKSKTFDDALTQNQSANHIFSPKTSCAVIGSTSGIRIRRSGIRCICAMRVIS